MDKQKNLKVSILGKNYLITTDEEHETITEAALLVNEIMQKKIGNVQATSNHEAAAIVTALQLASDVLKKKTFLHESDNKALELSLLIDEYL